MREIKFRGKVLHNNPMVNPADGWVEGFYYQDLVNGEISHFIRSFECEWLINPETLGQFTGLHDKHGKEIYEGDIIRYLDADDKWRISRVEYSSTSIDPLNMLMLYSGFLNNDEFANEFRIEVIGNIYDNPELSVE